MAANAVTNLAADPQPVGRVDFREAADLPAEANGIEPLDIVGRILVAFEQKLSGRAGAETPFVEQGEGDIVIALGEARLRAGFA